MPDIPKAFPNDSSEEKEREDVLKFLKESDPTLAEDMKKAEEPVSVKKKFKRRKPHQFESEQQRRAIMAARRGDTSVPGHTDISVSAASNFLSEALPRGTNAPWRERARKGMKFHG